MKTGLAIAALWIISALLGVNALVSFIDIFTESVIYTSPGLALGLSIFLALACTVTAIILGIRAARRGLNAFISSSKKRRGKGDDVFGALEDAMDSFDLD